MKRTWIKRMNLFVAAIEKIRPALALYAVALFVYLMVFPPLILIGAFVRPVAAELTFVLFLLYSLIAFSIDVISTLCDVNGVVIQKILCGLHIAALALLLSAGWFFGKALGFDGWQLIALLVGAFFTCAFVRLLMIWSIRKRNFKKGE